jgi:hypothetical protein
VPGKIVYDGELLLGMGRHPNGVKTTTFHVKFRMLLLWIESVHAAQRVEVDGCVRNQDDVPERDHSLYS